MEMIALVGGLCCVGVINHIGDEATKGNSVPGGITGPPCSWGI
jgi:hypothetical protein